MGRPRPNTKMTKITEKQFHTLRKIVGAATIIVMAAIIMLNFQVSGIRQHSMEHTLKRGDLCVAKYTKSANRNDIVIFWVPDHGLMIKRVIAVGGDTVAIHDNEVFVNGEKLDESSYIHEGGTAGEIEEEVVPEGHLFVMGDNRRQSGDSRLMGPVPCENLRSKILFWF